MRHKSTCHVKYWKNRLAQTHVISRSLYVQTRDHLEILPSNLKATNAYQDDDSSIETACLSVQTPTKLPLILECKSGNDAYYIRPLPRSFTVSDHRFNSNYLEHISSWICFIVTSPSTQYQIKRYVFSATKKGRCIESTGN